MKEPPYDAASPRMLAERARLELERLRRERYRQIIVGGLVLSKDSKEIWRDQSGSAYKVIEAEGSLIIDRDWDTR